MLNIHLGISCSAISWRVHHKFSTYCCRGSSGHPVFNSQFGYHRRDEDTERRQIRRSKSENLCSHVVTGPILCQLGHHGSPSSLIARVLRRCWIGKNREARRSKRFCRNVCIVTAVSVTMDWIGDWSRRPKKDMSAFSPTTSYPRSYLDQAVTLAAGILTVLLGTVEAFSSRAVSEWEEFDDWRQRTRLFLDAKVLGDEEAALWEERYGCCRWKGG